jgi:hypothetical protein
MGCWHGCGPVHCGPASRGWYGPADEDVAYQDVNRALRRPARARPGNREMRVASLEGRLDELRDELRRVEAALAEFGKQG